jgi:hypothetical protein
VPPITNHLEQRAFTGPNSGDRRGKTISSHISISSLENGGKPVVPSDVGHMPIHAA